MKPQTINPTDLIYATVTCQGVPLAEYTLSGVASLPALLATVRRRLSGVAGMVRVTVRNATAGWRTDAHCMMARPRPQEGLQYTLF